MRKAIYWLRIGTDYLDDAVGYESKRAAIAAYREVVDEFSRFGNMPPDASVHITFSPADDPDEYPDFVLSQGPRGGVRIEGA